MQARNVLLVILAVLIAFVLGWWVATLPEREDDEVPPRDPGVPEKPEKPESPVKARNNFGIAEIVLRPDDKGACRLDSKSGRSFAWVGQPHVWMIRSYCIPGTEAWVELGGFRYEREQQELDPFEPREPRRAGVRGYTAVPLVLKVREDAEMGRYTYWIEVDGERHNPTDIIIRDPWVF